MSFTVAQLWEVIAELDAMPKPETVELPLNVWLLMNHLADALDGGDETSCISYS